MAEKKQKDFCDMTVSELTKLMAGPSPLNRKNAAKILVERVKESPESFKKSIPDFIDALSRPEAQTRWLALDSLTMLVPVDTKACKAAIEGAEEALFDEKTALIRESAIRFLSRYGATSMQRSKEVWPLIKDALQQYHGEIDYDRMLNRVFYFASGNLDISVKKDFRNVVKDISNSVGGSTKKRLNIILLELKGQKMATTTKKAAAKKATPKKKVTKKATPKKKVAKKTTKKATPKKRVTKKATPKKKVTKKATPKKKAAKKTTKKATPKKRVTKKATPKKKAAKKTTKRVTKKATPKKKVTKKATPKKKAAKKTTKKATPKKKVAKKPAKKATKKVTRKPAKKTTKKKSASKKRTRK